MSVALVIGAFAAGLALAVAKGILGKEIQGRIERGIERHVEATIASLPDALRVTYEEEWRAELAVTLAMPLTAAALARGLRRSARQFAIAARPAPEHARPYPPVRPGRSLLALRGWHVIRWVVVLITGIAGLAYVGGGLLVIVWPVIQGTADAESLATGAGGVVFGSVAIWGSVHVARRRVPARRG